MAMEHAAGHGGDECGRGAFPRNVGNASPPAIIAERDVVVEISAEHACGDVFSSNDKAGNDGIFFGEEDVLDLAGTAKLGIHVPFLGGLLVGHGIVEGKGGLLDERLEDLEVVFSESPIRLGRRNGEDAEASIPEAEGAEHDGAIGLERIGGAGELLVLPEIGEDLAAFLRHRIAEDAFVDADGVEPHVAEEGIGVGLGAEDDPLRQVDEGDAFVREVAGNEGLAFGVGEVEGSSGAFGDFEGPLDDESIHGEVVVRPRDGDAEIVEEAEHPPFLSNDGFFVGAELFDGATVALSGDQKGNQQSCHRKREQDDDIGDHEYGWRQAGPVRTSLMKPTDGRPLPF